MKKTVLRYVSILAAMFALVAMPVSLAGGNDHQIAILTEYLNIGPSMLDVAIMERGYPLDEPRAEWERRPPVQRLEIAYRRAEAAIPGSGEDLLAGITQDLAKDFDGISSDPELASLLNKNPRTKNFEFSSLFDMNQPLPKTFRRAIMLVSDYSYPGYLGSPSVVLTKYFGFSLEDSYDLQLRSSSYQSMLNSACSRSIKNCSIGLVRALTDLSVHIPALRFEHSLRTMFSNSSERVRKTNGVSIRQDAPGGSIRPSSVKQESVFGSSRGTPRAVPPDVRSMDAKNFSAPKSEGGSEPGWEAPEVYFADIPHSSEPVSVRRSTTEQAHAEARSRFAASYQSSLLWKSRVSRVGGDSGGHRDGGETHRGGTSSGDGGRSGGHGGRIRRRFKGIEVGARVLVSGSLVPERIVFAPFHDQPEFGWLYFVDSAADRVDYAGPISHEHLTVALTLMDSLTEFHGIHDPHHVGIVSLDEAVAYPLCDQEGKVSEVDAVHAKVVMHPALVNTGIGWSLLSVDASPFAKERRLTTIDLFPDHLANAALGRSASSHSVWQFQDVQTAVVRINDDQVVPVRWVGSDLIREDLWAGKSLLGLSLAEGLFGANKDLRGYVLLSQFHRHSKYLVDADYHFDNVNRFMGTLALVRAFYQSGAKFELPERPAQGPETPMAVWVSESGEVLAASPAGSTIGYSSRGCLAADATMRQLDTIVVLAKSFLSNAAIFLTACVFVKFEETTFVRMLVGGVIALATFGVRVAMLPIRLVFGVDPSSVIIWFLVLPFRVLAWLARWFLHFLQYVHPIIVRNVGSSRQG